MVYLFGPFSFDPHESRLLRDGAEVSLTPKAADLLGALLARHGQLVTKAELFDRVWAGAFVSESTLTFHMHLIRKALASPAGANEDAYVEVVRGRGYRFVAAVTEQTAQTALPREPSPPPAPSTLPARRRVGSALALTLSIGIAIGCAVIGGRLMLRETRASTLPRVVNVRQLSHVGGGGVSEGLVFSDGLRIYFDVIDGDGAGHLVAVGPQGGTAEPVWPGTEFAPFDISVARSEVLARRTTCRTDDGCELWAVPLAGGSPRRVGDLIASSAVWSVDGRRILYAVGHDIRIAEADGSKARTVFTAAETPRDLSWSPDG